jgi:hypothetical protein
MLPDKLSGKKPVVPDNYLFVPDKVRDGPLIFRLGCLKAVSSSSRSVGLMVEARGFCTWEFPV